MSRKWQKPTKVADGSNARGLDGFSISQVDGMEARPVSTFFTAHCLRKQIKLKGQSEKGGQAFWGLNL